MGQDDWTTLPGRAGSRTTGQRVGESCDHRTPEHDHPFPPIRCPSPTRPRRPTAPPITARPSTPAGAWIGAPATAAAGTQWDHRPVGLSRRGRWSYLDGLHPQDFASAGLGVFLDEAPGDPALDAHAGRGAGEQAWRLDSRPRRPEGAENTAGWVSAGSRSGSPTARAWPSEQGDEELWGFGLEAVRGRPTGPRCVGDALRCLAGDARPVTARCSRSHSRRTPRPWWRRRGLVERRWGDRRG